VHLQRKQHVLEKGTLQLRKLREQHQQEKEQVLEVKRENVRTNSLFLKLTEPKNFVVSF
jgi:hypothetical protein